MGKIVRFIIFSTILFLAACGGEQVETTMSSDIAPFEAVNQDGDPVTNETFIGQYWIADFVFTNCTTVCLPMTANMQKLQDKIKEENLDNVHLVSFSVDPDYDTPEVLTEYADDYGADLEGWSFLTGYDFEEIKEISIGSFKSLLAEPPEGDDQVSHGTSFFLVSPDGEVIKNYKGIEADAMDDIVSDLKNLQ